MKEAIDKIMFSYVYIGTVLFFVFPVNIFFIFTGKTLLGVFLLSCQIPWCLRLSDRVMVKYNELGDANEWDG